MTALKTIHWLPPEPHKTHQASQPAPAEGRVEGRAVAQSQPPSILHTNLHTNQRQRALDGVKYATEIVRLAASPGKIGWPAMAK